MWQDKKKLKMTPLHGFSKYFTAWLISHFLLKITSNVEQMWSFAQFNQINTSPKKIIKDIGRNASENRKTLNLFLVAYGFLCTNVFIHPLENKSRWVKMV